MSDSGFRAELERKAGWLHFQLATIKSQSLLKASQRVCVLLLPESGISHPQRLRQSLDVVLLREKGAGIQQLSSYRCVRPCV